jgi:hypothetical protein
MNTETAHDNDREHLERRREAVMRRLMPVIDAIDRKRHAVTDAVGHVFPRRGELASVPGRDRAIFVAAGALAGAAAFTLAALAARWRREHNRPINRLARTVTLLAPRRPSLFKTVLRAAGSAIVSHAAEVAEQRLLAIVRERVERFNDTDATAVLEVTPAPAEAQLAPPTLPTAASPTVVASQNVHVPPPVPPEAITTSSLDPDHITLTGVPSPFRPRST